MQDYPDAESWSYLDKLICQWRKEEDKVREACGLPPVQPYGRCALLRNQQPTQEWLDEAAGLIFVSGSNQTSNVPPTEPNDEPTYNESGVVDPIGPSAAPSLSPGLREPEFGQPASFLAPSSQPSVTSDFTGSEVDSTIPPPIDCLDLGDVIDRMCFSEDPCCTTPRTNTVFCGNIYDNIFPGDAMKSACYHCCATPLTVGDVEIVVPGVADVSSDMPSDIPTTAPNSSITTDIVPPPIDCGNDQTLINRMCSSTDPCCGSPRSDTMFCWNIYDNVFPGEQIKSACHHCCSEPKAVAEERPINPAIPKTIKCSEVDNPYRMCKANSCCSSPRSNSEFCKSVYAKHKDDIDSICQYCCREPLTVGSARYLRSGGDEEDEHVVNHQARSLHLDGDDLQDGDEVVYISGKKYILRKDNYDDDEENTAKSFHHIHTERKKRNLNVVVHEEDYNDIPWFAYEWLVKVGTEYYHRYEGTQMVPPCWEVVHWRVMKDPIRVHPRQVAELNRLLAWRLNADTCQSDTAGVVSGDTVDASREVMYYHDLHRMVFCECPAWPSQFEGDQEWCRNYRDDTNYDRFYTRPYSFDSDNQWLPDGV